jgi:hypothetical protein
MLTLRRCTQRQQSNVSQCQHSSASGSAPRSRGLWRSVYTAANAPVALTSKSRWRRVRLWATHEQRSNDHVVVGQYEHHCTIELVAMEPILGGGDRLPEVAPLKLEVVHPLAVASIYEATHCQCRQWGTSFSYETEALTLSRRLDSTIEHVLNRDSKSPYIVRQCRCISTQVSLETAF